MIVPMYEPFTPRQRDSLTDVATEVWRAMETLQGYADRRHTRREDLLRARVQCFDALTRLNEMGVPIPRLPSAREMDR